MSVCVSRCVTMPTRKCKRGNKHICWVKVNVNTKEKHMWVCEDEWCRCVYGGTSRLLFEWDNKWEWLWQLVWTLSGKESVEKRENQIVVSRKQFTKQRAYKIVVKYNERLNNCRENCCEEFKPESWLNRQQTIYKLEIQNGIGVPCK